LTAAKLGRDTLALLGPLPDHFASIEVASLRADLARWVESPGAVRFELRRAD
jgi:hypothetical protein